MIGSLTGIPSELPQAHGVEPHHCDDRKSERDEREIEHERLLAGRVRTVERRKFSISIRTARHKDFIKPSIRINMQYARQLTRRGEERISSGAMFWRRLLNEAPISKIVRTAL